MWMLTTWSAAIWILTASEQPAHDPAGQSALAPSHAKDQTMGYSTPKPPFDLTEFLTKKGKPQSGRKPAWNRRPAVAPKAADTPVAPDESQTPISV